jgi:hypothetical protein
MVGLKCGQYKRCNKPVSAAACFRFKSEFHQHLQEPFQELIKRWWIIKCGQYQRCEQTSFYSKRLDLKAPLTRQHLQERFQELIKRWLDYQMWIPAMRTNQFFFGYSNSIRFKSNLESPTLTGLPLGSNTKPRSF